MLSLAKAVSVNRLSAMLLLVALVLVTVLTIPSAVNARAVEPQQSVASPEAATCGGWIYGVARTTMTVAGGAGGVAIDYGYRRNGCVIEGRWVSCGHHTSIISIERRWCGFYQPSNWNKTKLHVGYDYTVCSTPIRGVGPCWGEYLRTQVTATGAKSSWGSSIFIITQ
jgi:hypothetical protein